MIRRKGINVEPGQIWTIGKMTMASINNSPVTKFHKNFTFIDNKVRILKASGVSIQVRDSKDQITFYVKSQQLGKLLKDC